MMKADSLTTSPDEATAIDNINAILLYVQSVRETELEAHPDVLALVEDFEGWYQGLEESAFSGLPLIRHTVNQADVNEAKRRRFAINQILGRKLPDDFVPADGPQTPPQKPPSNQDPITTALVVVGTIATGYFLLKILG